MSNMASTQNQNNEQKNNTVEDALWQALDLDSLHNQMTGEVSTEREAMYMGTGYTHNACNMCDNSHKHCPPGKQAN